MHNFTKLINTYKTRLKLKIDNKIFSEGFIKIIKLMIPFTPHLALECLSLLNCKNTDDWPKVDEKIFKKA